LLDHGANPNIPQNHPPYGTALLKHADEGNHDIVKLLIDHGADIYDGWDRLGFGYQNAFSSALSKGHFNIINLLLETLQKKAEQNDIDWSKLDWLNTAIRHGDKTLIEQVFSIVVRNEECLNTALETALDSEDYDLAKKLLKHGAKPYEYAVNNAVLEGDWVRVNFLLKNGGKIRAENLPDAVRKGDMEAVTFLLKHGANIDEKDSYGCTALFQAVADGHFNLVKVLLKKGASVNIVNSMVNDKTPLMTALWKLHKNQYDDSSAKTYLQIIKTLLKSDADPHLIVEFNDSDGFPYKRSAYELVHMADDYENEVKRLFDKYSKSKKNKWTLLRIFKKQK
jgi:ankyrin repeat protein